MIVEVLPSVMIPGGPGEPARRTPALLRSAGRRLAPLGSWRVATGPADPLPGSRSGYNWGTPPGTTSVRGTQAGYTLTYMHESPGVSTCMNNLKPTRTSCRRPWRRCCRAACFAKGAVYCATRARLELVFTPRKNAFLCFLLILARRLQPLWERRAAALRGPPRVQASGGGRRLQSTQKPRGADGCPLLGQPDPAPVPVSLGLQKVVKEEDPWVRSWTHTSGPWAEPSQEGRQQRERSIVAEKPHQDWETVKKAISINAAMGGTARAPERPKWPVKNVIREPL